MSNWRKSLLQYGIILCMTALCIEGASLIYIASTQGRFHYATPPYSTANATQWTIPQTRLHPYFGYLSDLAFFPGLPGQPDGPQPDEALVGIFGGSVAQGLYVSQNATNILRDALQALPRFAGKRVRIVNFAHSGYKQPQQLNVFSFYLANGMPLEVAILLDGLNEVGFNSVNFDHGLDPSMPMAPVFSDLVRQCSAGDQLEASTCQLVAVRQRASRLQALAEQTPLAAGHLLFATLAKRSRAQYWALSKNREAQNTTASLVSYIPAPTSPDLRASLERSVQTWRFCSLAMLQIARQAGVELFEFVQPNQYYPTHRTLTEEERAIAWNDKSILLRSLEPGYALFFQQIESLRQAGLRVYDMTRVFDDLDETIYVDTCCHTNLQGYVAMEQFIADTVARELGDTPAP
ncbi:MAG: hypothetical protein LDL30_05010 [Desulfovibrio sp.]|nr:hypothetical protein [Desulfovibrio sp.]MCA1987303.1 hypothetical protein [Desulfovibrio sp.]